MVYRSSRCESRQSQFNTLTLWGPFVAVPADVPSFSTRGPSARSRYATPPPPLLRALWAHLVTKGQRLLTIHMVAPKAPEIFFFIPLAHVASLPAQAVEHPNAILEP